MEPLSLATLLGKDLLIKIPSFRGGALLTVRLLGVETGGIWIQSSEFMEDMFKETEHRMSAKTFAIFVPFSQILAIYTMIDSPWISERVAE